MKTTALFWFYLVCWLAALPAVRGQSAGTISSTSDIFYVAENQTNALIEVIRTGGTEGTISVHYATSDGTAAAGADYIAQSGTLIFAVGEDIKTVSIPILEDGLVEGDEMLNLVLKI